MTDSRPGGPVPLPVPRITLRTQLDLDQYAAGGDHELHAFLHVRALGLGGSAVPDQAAAGHTEVVIIDCSGSMGHPTVRKIAAARRAAEAAIAMLPEGTHFALVEGTHEARLAYPWRTGGGPATVPVTPQSRAEGMRTARALDAHGGTRISGWLELARKLLRTRPGPTFRHALLLTDGRDEHGAAEELRRVLDACEGEFTCDALGVGEDWDAHQLLDITGRLHGRAAAVDMSGADSVQEQLTGMFRALVAASIARVLPQLVLWVRPEPYLRMTLFRQLAPQVLDLTGAAERSGDDGTIRFPTGAWGEESRWYELRLRADPDHPGYRAAKAAPGPVAVATVGVGVGTDGGADGGAEADTAAGPGGPADPLLPPETVLRVRWTGEQPPLSRPAGHWTRYTELNQAARQGAEALLWQRFEEAERELSRAVRLAHELGDTKRLRSLGRLVRILDPATGRVQVHEVLDRAQIQGVILGSVHTEPPPEDGDPEPEPPGSEGEERPVRCPQCDEWVPPGRYCTNCGHELTDTP
ncbi:VWA domain-containing protein [Streptomyces aidingensis]|uniref:von Willebrand factor type A domain-containing protein n=1 Tax=Streptomyces aidingensis TaxID=910347 RepID=A0A1I1QWR1_9ACTN|nr:VWA domain-containing protein [Streptomyces aidingensis]SFD26561.1 von Willebrand factor type A domain-containing protein [Streptomyces aidingensis]